MNFRYVLFAIAATGGRAQVRKQRDEHQAI